MSGHDETMAATDDGAWKSPEDQHAEVVAGLKTQLAHAKGELAQREHELNAATIAITNLSNEREALISAVLAMARMCAKIMDAKL